MDQFRILRLASIWIELNRIFLAFTRQHCLDVFDAHGFDRQLGREEREDLRVDDVLSCCLTESLHVSL